MRAARFAIRLWIALAAVAGLLVTTAVLGYPKLRALWHRHQLAERLHGPDAADRLNAAIALGRLRDARAAPILLDALAKGEGADPRTEEEITALCSSGRSREFTAGLRQAGQDRSALVRALVCINDDEARAILAGALREGDAGLVRSIAGTLSEAGDPSLAELLVKAQGDAGRDRRRLILAAMNAPGGGPPNPRVAGVLNLAANNPDATIRGAASASLRWIALNSRGSAGEWAQDSEMRQDDTVVAQLAVSARRAAAFIAARQDSSGYWRTLRSPAPRFEGAVREKNTYLTPLIVDLLRPVANPAGLAGNIATALRQISGEIEPSGLVRYYGVGPGSPSREQGCTISFDADDTALAWRVAPPADPARLRNALATLRRYRAPSGLYRTWLAPPDRLKCVDRGSDPNPTDIGIQMHLLMFLAGVQPAAARELCANLGRSVADDRIWVYYQREPLIPMLRQTNLERAGCPLRIPQARMRTEIPGQGKWLAVVRALSGAGEDAGRGARIALLLRLAEDDFAPVRRAPPLLYQNDATGSIPAFYWSQEFGFALWLRLYFDTLHGQPA